ncbi:hypothetical protein [Paenibacillus sp. NPDC057934]|uniref:hypothetical protein n=1 Tax=Paenibacillus sp. NPDC057934 TaxID=3346282 RepID=UPI0036D76038
MLDQEAVDRARENNVKEDVYGKEALQFPRSNLTPFAIKPTVSDTVYEQNDENNGGKEAMVSFATLSATISDIIQDNTMAQINQTFKEQYSDHYGTAETIDPVTGSLSWKDNQISLPGRDGLDLNIGVIYNSNQTSSEAKHLIIFMMKDTLITLYLIIIMHIRNTI